MSISAQTSVTNLLPMLHRTNPALTGASSNASIQADLVFWSKKELFRWYDEAVKNLAKLVPVFIRRDDTAVVLVAGTSAYAKPARHIRTLYGALNDVSLRSATTQELEARDRFMIRPGTPERFHEDKSGNQFGLYPVPVAGDVGGTVALWQSEWPPEVDENGANVTVAAPAIIGDWLELCVLKEAYGKESDAQSPEIAMQAGETVKLLAGAFVDTWGENA